jgi:glycosyltransferase involved in cell wall biosynthesis
LAASNLPQNSYEFIGFVPEDQIRQFYCSAQVFLFPSRYGFGLSSVESMACGTPSIVGATLDALDLFDDNELTTDPEKPEELARKILALLSDVQLYKQKQRWGLNMASRFSWESMGSKYLDTFLMIAQS